MFSFKFEKKSFSLNLIFIKFLKKINFSGKLNNKYFFCHFAFFYY
jgi:hypothetical protein